MSENSNHKIRIFILLAALFNISTNTLNLVATYQNYERYQEDEFNLLRNLYSVVDIFLLAPFDILKIYMIIRFWSMCRRYITILEREFKFNKRLFRFYLTFLISMMSINFVMKMTIKIW